LSRNKTTININLALVKLRVTVAHEAYCVKEPVECENGYDMQHELWCKRTGNLYYPEIISRSSSPEQHIMNCNIKNVYFARLKTYHLWKEWEIIMFAC
jgi:hypothetical protein